MGYINAILGYIQINAWKIMLAWFVLIIAVFSVAGGWSLVAFGITYGLIFGGIAYKFRKKIRPFFRKLGLDNYFGFLLLCIFVTVTEEVYCYMLGNRIAYPILWIDLILVTILWTIWFGTWYFFLSKKYAFSEKETLLIAGFTGVLFEYVGTGAFINDPFGFLLAIPLAVVVYAAIFVLPMQLINFTGKNESKLKYLVGAVLPFLLTIPVAIISYIVLSI